MEFSRQGYWSGLPFPSPGDLPNPGIEPMSPALAGRFFTAEPPGKLVFRHTCSHFWGKYTRVRSRELYLQRGYKQAQCFTKQAIEWKEYWMGSQKTLSLISNMMLGKPFSLGLIFPSLKWGARNWWFLQSFEDPTILWFWGDRKEVFASFHIGFIVLYIESQVQA